MAELTEDLAEAKAISAREVSIRDGILNKYLYHYFMLSGVFGQTGVAYKEGLYDGSLLSYALTSSSSLFVHFWVAYLIVFTSRLLKL